MAFDGDNKLDYMQDILAQQKKAHQNDTIPSVEQRIDWIDRAIAILVDYRGDFEKAICEDFGHRSMDTSAFADIMASISALKFSKKNLKKWMRPEKRQAEFPLNILGSKAQVEYQPKGVVGILAPWNFPVGMVFNPLANIFAAGNRAMVKPSEFTEKTSDLMGELIGKYYKSDELAVVTGGPEVGAAFTSLPFDHMIFTGATSIAKHVMRAASENLVPLTLELGGKSPTILGESADFEKAAKRIMVGKTMNAGQICLAPDYVMAPEKRVGEFVDHAKNAVNEMYPSGLRDNDDYTSVINQRHYDRMMGYIEDAKDKGAEIVQLNPKDEDFSQQEHRKIPPTLVLNPSEDMKVMQDEIFGPLMPVTGYKNTQAVVDYVNAHERPLALYYFGTDKAEEAQILNNTTSGGVTVNDVIMHVAQEDLPFGGVGPSGMGVYHGHDGFKEFSHMKSVLRQTSNDLVGKMFRPPYTDMFKKQVDGRIKK